MYCSREVEGTDVSEAGAILYEYKYTKAELGSAHP